MAAAATPTASPSADALIARVGGGLILFQKDTTCIGQWRIIGPASTVIPGHDVQVTKADGTTKTVYVTCVARGGERNGIAYSIADFRDRRATTLTSRMVREHDAADAAGREHGITGQIWD